MGGARSRLVRPTFGISTDAADGGRQIGNGVSGDDAASAHQGWALDGRRRRAAMLAVVVRYEFYDPPG
jgi:hypothetical protein